MEKGIRWPFKWVQSKVEELRFRRLASGLPYHPVELRDPGEISARRRFLLKVIGGVLAVLGTIPILNATKWRRLECWAEELQSDAPKTSDEEDLPSEELVGSSHRNEPHQNSHLNAQHANFSFPPPGRTHSDIPHSNQHVNTTHRNITIGGPHLNSHANSPGYHTNLHTNMRPYKTHSNTHRNTSGTHSNHHTNVY